MQDVDVRLERALRAGKPRCILVYIDHPDGPVRVWSRAGTLSWDGFDWQGVGTLGRISGMASSTRVALKPITFQLKGVPANRARFLGSKIKGRVGKIWLGALKDSVLGQQLVCDPMLQCVSRLDYQTFKAEENGTLTVQIIGNVGFWNVSQPANEAWTHEWQIARYPLDTGLSLIPSLTDKEVKWRKTA